MVRDVLDAGARGYVLKSDAGRDLVSAVEALLQHRMFFSPMISDMLFPLICREPNARPPR